MKNTNNKFKLKNVFLILIVFILAIGLYFLILLLNPNNWAGVEKMNKGVKPCSFNHYMIYDEKTGENKCVKEAKLYIDKENYKTDDNVMLSLENFGPRNLSTGYPYTVEKYKQGKWENVSFNGMFTLKGLAIKPGDKLEQTLELKNFEKGEYRITKSFNNGERDSQRSLSVYFKVVD